MASGQGEEELGVTPSWIQGFLFGVMTRLGTRQRRWLHNMVNVLSVSELHTLK